MYRILVIEDDFFDGGGNEKADGILGEPGLADI